MLYLVVVSIFALTLSCNAKLIQDDDNIDINGTEFRAMVNATLWSRQQFWYVNMTRDMVSPRLRGQRNTSQSDWEKKHNESD